MLLAMVYCKSELPCFWTLAIVRYSKNTREHNVSETVPVSEMCSVAFLEHQMMDKVQKHSNSEWKDIVAVTTESTGGSHVTRLQPVGQPCFTLLSESVIKIGNEEARHGL
jgi:hypothetical protein